jgi:DNA-binding transcriptional LysR family regulator
MNRYRDIPTELLRAAVFIAETGSLSKAADRLGISQPAISLQVKRLQNLVGGALFERTPTGTVSTELGKLVLQHAKKILEANDQILMFRGVEPKVQPLKLGLSPPFARDFYSKTNTKMLSGLAVQFNKSTPIVKGLFEGYVDIACVFEARDFAIDIERFVVDRATDRLVWVRSRNFSMPEGTPLPIIAWIGDDWMLRTLDSKGISYRITTNTSDYHARLVALEAGVGLSVFPASRVPQSLVVAPEKYLPELPTVKSLLCVRENIESPRADVILQHLSTLFFKGVVDAGA